MRVDDELSPPLDVEYLTLARMLITQHRPDEVVPLLGRLLHLAEMQGRMGNALEILVLQAVAELSRGDVNQALVTLSRALSLAEPEGYIRLFADEGSPMANLLSQMWTRQRGVQRGTPNRFSLDYVEKLLAALGTQYPQSMSQPPGPTPFNISYPLVEPLSERELAVLRLIVAGYSNREIADRLVLAVSTVKWYVNTIYSKLQVESRTKAIGRARELNIV